MSYLLEVYYKPPADSNRETLLSDRVARYGGQLTYREEPTGEETAAVGLTYEFDDLARAEAAADSLRQEGVHVEGPADYST